MVDVNDPPKFIDYPTPLIIGYPRRTYTDSLIPMPIFTVQVISVHYEIIQRFYWPYLCIIISMKKGIKFVLHCNYDLVCRRLIRTRVTTVSWFILCWAILNIRIVSTLIPRQDPYTLKETRTWHLSTISSFRSQINRQKDSNLTSLSILKHVLFFSITRS